MELFKITCVTCKARLSVRNREIIGQIVACPRCDSMVQVEVPAAAAGAIAADAVTTKSVETRSIESGAEQSVAPNEFAEAVPDTSPVEPEQVPAEDVSLQASVAATKYKLVAWTLASIVVGVAIGGAVVFLRGDSAENNASVSLPQPQQETVDEDLLVETPDEIATEPSTETNEPSTINEQPMPPAEESESAVAIDDTDAGQAVPEETNELLTEVTAVEIVDQPRVAARFDALELDPDSLDLEMLKGVAGDRAVADPVDAATDDVEPQEPAELAEASTLPVARRDPEQQNRTTPAAEERLSQRFPALTVKAMPISDFLDLLSRLGGVPISVSPRQLQMAGISSRRSVSLDAKEISLAEALSRVLDPLHLEFTTIESQVVVVRQQAKKLREIEYPLDDLVNETTSLETIAGWVEQFVVPTVSQLPDRPVVLDSDANTLRFDQPQEFQYQVLIFLERLRLARGLQPRSRFPVERLAGKSASATLAERLGAQTTFTFSHYTSLNEVVRYWQQELDVPILVDWSALDDVELWPESRVVCAIDSESWREALDHVLEPLGLGWRAASGGALEITSAEKSRSELQLELYQLRRELAGDAEQVLGELRKVLGNESADIAYDPTGKVIIALQPATAQRLIWQWLVDEKLAQID